ncbi:MAG: hypothetical protein ACK493_15115 [Planctomycetota bacterium]|jgi:hypothetical protein|nr:hypothetical protein [Blastopirellula sp.]
MPQPWWIILLKVSVSTLLFTAAMRWVSSQQQRRWSAPRSGKLQHQSWILLTGILTIGLFLALAIFSNTWGKNSTTTIWTTLTFLGFAALGVPFVADYLFARHDVNHNGISAGSMFGYRRMFAWSSIQRISFSPNCGWFVLESETGKRARVSVLLIGLGEFAALALQHVPREKMDQLAYINLMDAASEGCGMAIDPDSDAWKQALAKTQSSIPLLRDLYSSVSEPILVKYPLASQSGALEHVWGELQELGETDFRASLETPPLSGSPSSPPPFLLPLTALEDWLLVLPDGTIRGGFTTQAELAMAKEQRIPLPAKLAAVNGCFLDC